MPTGLTLAEPVSYRFHPDGDGQGCAPRDTATGLGMRPVHVPTENTGTYNPLRVATHEYASIARDLAEARTWGDRLRRPATGPGRQPVRTDRPEGTTA